MDKNRKEFNEWLDTCPRFDFDKEYKEYDGRLIFQIFNKYYTGQMLMAWIVNYMSTNEINAKEVIEILGKHESDLKFDKSLEKIYEGDDNWDNWSEGNST